MEYYDSNQMTDLSVRDVFESEVQTEMDQLLSSEAASYSQQGESVDVVELSCVSESMESVTGSVWDPTVENTLGGTTSTHSVTTASTTNTVDFAQLTSPDKYGLEGNTLLVDPQTGLPVTALNLQSNDNSQQQLNLIVSAADSSGQTVQHQIPVSLNLGNINMNLSSQDQGLYTQPQLLTVTADGQHQPVHHSHQQSVTNQQITFQNAAATLQGLQAAFQQIPLQNQNLQSRSTPTSTPGRTLNSKLELESKNEKVWSKPPYSYSCLITMALKNCKTGCLPVSEIYQFMCGHFPYFKTAPDGWKNSVRHNLSLNKCFAKIEKPQTSNTGARKGCLWALNPEKTKKMEEEVVKWTKKDPAGIRRAMSNPDELERIEAAVTGNHHTPHLLNKMSTTPIHKIKPKVSPITSTPTRITPKIEPKITISDDFGSSTNQQQGQINPDLFTATPFTGDINILTDPSLMSFEGDFSLQDQLSSTLGLDRFDPLNCGDFMNLDIPMATTSLPHNPVMSTLMTAESPIKDVSNSLNLSGLDHQQYNQSQFSSPSRMSVAALM